MDILVVDPDGAIAPTAEPVFRDKGWRSEVATDRARALDRALHEVPDAVVLHGDGRRGETTHLCQRFKGNPLTAGIPLVLVEDDPPPAWLLAGMPADAFTFPPFEASELLHHLEVLAPITEGTGDLDDLTNFPRRRAILAEVGRRLAARELFGAGLLALREPDAYRQDFGRAGVDQFAVLVSVVLRRHAALTTPVEIGYLADGGFLVLGAPSVVHHLLARTIRDFEALVPAYYEMDTLFGGQDAQTGPTTWVGLEGAICLAEAERFDNALQVGFVLAEALSEGQAALRQAATDGDAAEPSRLVAD